MPRKPVIGSALAAIAMLTNTGFAQVTNESAPGNLAPTQNPGCIAVADADPTLSPADLSMSVLDCVAKDEFDKAFELVLLLRLRATFDKKRVTDISAHQAGQVLVMQIGQRMTAEENSAYEKVGPVFGGTGSPRHAAFCALMKEAGPPAHDPSYMVNHGMRAFTDPNVSVLLEGFDPEQAWNDILSDFLKCG